MKNYIIKICGMVLIILLIPVLSHAKKVDTGQLLEMDGKLSAASEKEGILNAFLPLLTEQSALFPDRGHPVMGKVGCAQLLKSGVADLKQKWQPLEAGISQAGDFGYTHGRFTVPDKKDNNKKHDVWYETIWYKQKGKWRVLVSQGLLTIDGLNLKVMDTRYRTDIKKADKITRQLMETEISFSAYSGKHGISAAFHQFIADNGKVIRQFRPPATKAKYAADLVKKKSKSRKSPTLQWSPFFSKVSSSGDMGCNYGPYIFTSFNKENKPRKSYGYFITVWKKQTDNSWKFLLDGGNSSPPPEDL